MKRILLPLIFIALSLNAFAQHNGNTPKDGGKKEAPKIEEIVSDLTPAQKNNIDAITKRSSKIVASYRQQLHAVRDSIRTYMNSQEDNSSILFPLYEREARLQAEISKEYYRSKVDIDKVLTPEQYQQMNEAMKKKNNERKQQKGKKVQ